MSTVDTAQAAITADTFATKLGIEMGTPRVFEQMIEALAGTHAVVCAVGPSGIGKTAIPKQIAARRNPKGLHGRKRGVPYAQLHAPTATQEGFFVPTFSPDTKRYFDQRIPRTFQEVIEWGEKMDKEYDGKVPKELCPLLVIEELNRAPDKSVTRAAFVMIGDRMIGDTRIPGCVQIVVTMNPTGQGYAVNEFEKDPAMRRRLLPIGVDYSYGDFLLYAQSAGLHKDIVAHLGAHPEWGYDKAGSLAGKAFACPATWEATSVVIKELEACGDFDPRSTLVRAAVSAAIGTAAAAALLDYIKDHTLSVTPDDVLSSYAGTPTTETRRRFLAFMSEGGGRMDLVTSLAQGVAINIITNIDRPVAQYMDHLGQFASDLPSEIYMTWVTRITDEADRIGGETKQKVVELNRIYTAHPGFLAAMQKLHDAKLAADAEEDRKGQEAKR